ncbi:MAG: hypothetical protein AAB838_02425 [Patescibacteria group bacterium]
MAVLLRIWHLPETAQFSYDEARDATAEKSILNGTLTLLGPESQIGSKTIYFGPLHYYLMAPALKFSDYNPLGPYFLTAIIGGLTAALLAYFFSPAAGFFYAVFPLAVIYNRWAWNPNTIPFFIVLALIFASKNKYFFAGLFAGLATQLHWSAILILIFMLRPKVILGFIFGLLPIIIFDLRYNFLYSRSLLELINGPISRGLTWHYFLWLIPILAIKLPKKILLILIIVSVILIKIPKSVDALNPYYVRQMAKIIAYDQLEKPDLTFNVVSFYGGDFRANNLRYFLEVSPLGYSEYDVADHLYVVAPESPMYNGLWEIRSFNPKRISKTWQVGGTNIYRLEKL